MTNKVYAKTKYVRMAPRKVRLVVNLIRDMNALESVELLKYVNKRASEPVRKTIESAIANAVNNYNLDKYKLHIIEARVDEAPTFKRGRAVSKGRYHKILKRNSHIIIAVGILDDINLKAKERGEQKDSPKIVNKKDMGKKKAVNQKNIKSKVSKSDKKLKKNTKKVTKKSKRMVKSNKVDKHKQ